MKEFGKMLFYSTAQLAQKLNMNIQVIARKLQSGEIEGYKIGKDWRVEEDAVQKWLAKISNKNVLSPRDKILKNFIKNGKLTLLPAQRKKRLVVLEYFLEMFELNRSYTEAEVNALIKEHFDDFCTVRRLFIEERMMVRSGGNYQRLATYRMTGLLVPSSTQ